MEFRLKDKLLQDLADGIKKAEDENIKVGLLKVWFVTPNYKFAIYSVGTALDYIVNGIGLILFDGDPTDVRDTNNQPIGEKGTLYRLNSETTNLIVEYS